MIAVVDKLLVLIGDFVRERSIAARSFGVGAFSTDI